jgi:uncharacterized delta-60 repeat protein
MNTHKSFLLLITFHFFITIQAQEESSFITEQNRLLPFHDKYLNTYFGTTDFKLPGASSLTETYTISNPGRYVLTANIESDIGTGSNSIIYINSNNVYLDLNKKAIRMSNSTTSIDGILINNGKKNITIANGMISDVTENGISVGINSKNITIKNVYISNCDEAGINFTGTSSNEITHCFIKNCTITGCTGGTTVDAIGLKIDYCDFLTVENCTFSTNTTSTNNLDAYGVYATNSQQGSFFKSIASNNAGETIAAGFFLENCTNFYFNNCRANANIATDSSASEVYGFKLDNCNYCTLEECIGNNNSALYSAYGFALDTSANNYIFKCTGSNNSISQTDASDSCSGFVTLTANCNYNTFKECIANNNQNGNSSSTSGGIILNQADRCVIEDCTASHNGQSTGYAYGIILKSTCENTMVRNCKASNNSTTGVSSLPFNTTGYLNIEGDTDSHSFYSVAVQPDYKIVIVGFTDASPFDGLVARLNTDGSFDTTFNTTGYINSEGDTNSYVYNHVVLQDDGKIIVVGYTDGDDGIILRFNTDGSLDTTFNSTGYINLENGTNSYIYKKVAIQSDGKYVVVGQSDGNDGIVVRYNTDGSLDTTFNSTGYIITEDGTDSYLYDSVALQSDGKIVVVGRTDGSEGVIARYTTDGSLDPTFNTTGYFNAEGATGIDFNRLFGVAIQSDGKIVAVGRTDANDGLVARFNTDGTLDTTFNSTGYFNAENGTTSYLFYSLALDDDDKIIAVGYTNSSYGLIVRLNTNGTLDTTFNSTGYIINTVNDTNAYFFNDVTVQNDGKIIGVGRTKGNDGFIVRYTADGSLDTTINLRAIGIYDEHTSPSTNLIMDCFGFCNKDISNSCYNYYALYNYTANTLDVSYDSLASLTIPTHKNISINNR